MDHHVLHFVRYGIINQLFLTFIVAGKMFNNIQKEGFTSSKTCATNINNEIKLGMNYYLLKDRFPLISTYDQVIMSIQNDIGGSPCSPCPATDTTVLPGEMTTAAPPPAQLITTVKAGVATVAPPGSVPVLTAESPSQTTSSTTSDTTEPATTVSANKIELSIAHGWRNIFIVSVAIGCGGLMLTWFTFKFFSGVAQPPAPPPMPLQQQRMLLFRLPRRPPPRPRRRPRMAALQAYLPRKI